MDMKIISILNKLKDPNFFSQAYHSSMFLNQEKWIEFFALEIFILLKRKVQLTVTLKNFNFEQNINFASFDEKNRAQFTKKYLDDYLHSIDACIEKKLSWYWQEQKKQNSLTQDNFSHFFSIVNNVVRVDDFDNSFYHSKDDRQQGKIKSILEEFKATFNISKTRHPLTDLTNVIRTLSSEKKLADSKLLDLYINFLKNSFPNYNVLHLCSYQYNHKINKILDQKEKRINELQQEIDRLDRYSLCQDNLIREYIIKCIKELNTIEKQLIPIVEQLTLHFFYDVVLLNFMHLNLLKQITQLSEFFNRFFDFKKQMISRQSTVTHSINDLNTHSITSFNFHTTTASKMTTTDSCELSGMTSFPLLSKRRASF